MRDTPRPSAFAHLFGKAPEILTPSQASPPEGPKRRFAGPGPSPARPRFNLPRRPAGIASLRMPPKAPRGVPCARRIIP